MHCAAQKRHFCLYKDRHVLFVSFYHFICHFKNVLIDVYCLIYYGNYVNLNINTTMTDKPQSGNRNIYKITTVCVCGKLIYLRLDHRYLIINLN